MEVQRSGEYWFDDGNIVLQAEQTQFRVTKSMLAMHSTVFRDMLTIPLPPDEPVIDGCPIVFLPDDKPEDWKHLLDAMYPKRQATSFHWQSWPSQNPTLDVIHSILRLSRKYDVPAFRQECIRRLKLEFPSTFEGLEAVWGAWKHIEMDPGRGDINTVFQLINLSREFNLPSLLPLACYIVAASSSKEAMQRVSDGTSVPPLSVADQLICWKGHVELIKRGAVSKMAWLEAIGAEDSDCQHPNTCAKVARVILYHHGRQPEKSLSLINHWSPRWATGACENCLRRARQVYLEGRRENWENLPAIFGFPPWETLREMDSE
ncbi:BTB domain-containing protein [Mycena chlorophos]|uniref:BTB domain-containing protein n=1 Tax=Mycena chlorophos TaxID=658473 RepID=A0A8H6SBK8_MYCCL|nr:BTB domain-containing protein [Mycena chlorophos]